MERDGDRGLFRTPDDDAERAPMQVDESKPPLPEWFKIFLWDYDGLCIYIYIYLWELFIHVLYSSITRLRPSGPQLQACRIMPLWML